MDRKEMVKKLSEFLGAKQKYLGPPSFAYEIRTEEEVYNIDRHGGITNSARETLTFEGIVNPQEAKEEDAVIQEVETEEIEEAEIEEPLPIDGFELKLPLEEHTGRRLQNIINMLSSKQHLIMKAFETDTPFMDETFAEDLSTEEINTLETLKEAIDKRGKNRCLGLTFDLVEKTLTFTITDAPLTPERINAFKDLGVQINNYSKKLKRASFKQSQDDNPKYALRTWLTRIGMNGPEYKATRKTLLKNLEGSGAFRKVEVEDNND